MAKERDKLTPAVGGNSAGHVAADSRGRNVWQWNDSQLDSTTIMLQRLENDELELEPTRRVRAQSGAAPSSGDARDRKRRRRSSSDELTLDETFRVDQGGGFDPYNRS
jgi:hypothetical protein